MPYDLQKYPQTALVTSGSHSHPPPRRTKTPPIFVDYLNELLLDLDWRIADANLRQVTTDRQVTNRLRQILGKDDSHVVPTLSDLHPSFSNLDHVNLYVQQARLLKFPFGTDWEGAIKLKETHANTLPEDAQYIRLVKEFAPVGHDPFKIVLLMFPQQAEALRSAKWLICDTAYKRVQTWKEFGIDFWDSASQQCTSCYFITSKCALIYSLLSAFSACRAFTTSESAEAHRQLFHEIDAVVKADTGEWLMFYYLHGEGWQVITLDEHKGQALGELSQFPCASNVTSDRILQVLGCSYKMSPRTKVVQSPQ